MPVPSQFGYVSFDVQPESNENENKTPKNESLDVFATAVIRFLNAEIGGGDPSFRTIYGFLRREGKLGSQGLHMWSDESSFYGVQNNFIFGKNFPVKVF